MKKLAATVAYNQNKFHGKKFYWFRPMCKELGWEISDTFASRFLITLFVVCVDPEIFDNDLKEFGKSWGKKKEQVKKVLFDAVHTAEKKKRITYPSTFKLFKKLFPHILN